jgi:hypothetical protein
VDFHVATGLSSYWYSSGGSADPKKPGAEVEVGSFTVSPSTPVTPSDPVTAPALTAQPASTQVLVGAPTTLTAAATGGELTWLWQRQVGSSWVDLSGEGSASLRLPAVAVGDDGARFRVRVSNSAGTVVSAPATVTVTRHAGSVSVKAPRKQQVRLAAQRVVLRVTASAPGTVTVYDGRRVLATRRVDDTLRYRLPRGLAVGTHRVRVVLTPSSSDVASAQSRVVRVRVVR